MLLLTLAALEDWRTGYLSDGWSLLLAVTGFMTAFRRQGAGDLVLSTGAAFWLSPLTALLFIWFSALSALLFLAIPLLLGKKKAGDPVRFGPFIALGGVMAYGWQEIWGPLLPPWFPFG